MKAATRIQAFWKCYFYRQVFLTQRRRLVMIQTSIRARQKRLFYKDLKLAAITIQCRWRVRRSRFSFLVSRGAIIFLQRAWRGYQRLKNEKRQSAATTIENAFRKYWNQKKYGQWRRASIALQTNARRMILQKTYYSLRRLSTRMQALFRGWYRYRRYSALRSGVVTAQGMLRRYWQRRNDQAATTIQTSIRKMLCQTDFRCARYSAILLQKNWRMVWARSLYPVLRKQQTMAAIKLQSWYRCNIARFKFLIDLFSIVTAQTIWRTRCRQQEFLRLKIAVVSLQRCYRRKLAQKKEAAAALAIQSAVRRVFARRQELVARIQKQRADKVLQARARRRARFKFSKEREAAARSIQRVYRSFKEKNTASLMIQIQWRKYQRFKHLALQNECAYLIQKRLRLFICRKRYLLLKRGVFKLQAIQIATKRRDCFLHLKNTVIKVQSLWRRISSQQLYQQKLTSNVQLQSYFRMFRAQIVCKRARSAILFLQSSFRRRICQSIYRATELSVLLIQKQCRMISARSPYKKARTRAIALQSVWRGFKCRTFYARLRERFASLKNQAELWQFIKANSVTMISRNWRAFSQHSRFLNIRSKAISIQSMWRLYSQLKHYLRLQQSVVDVQSAWRRKMYQSRFGRLRCYIVKIQRKTRCDFLQRTSAVLKLQSNSRMHTAKQHLRLILASNLKIQRWTRTVIARRNLHARLVTIERCRQQRTLAANCICQFWLAFKIQKVMCVSACKIQGIYRGHITRIELAKEKSAAVCIQAWYRCKIARFKQLIKVISVTIIQSIYRGYRKRLEYSRAKRAASATLAS